MSWLPFAYLENHMQFDGTNILVGLGHNDCGETILTPFDMIEIIAFMKDRGIYLNEQKKRFIQAPGTWPDNGIFIPRRDR